MKNQFLYSLIISFFILGCGTTQQVVPTKYKPNFGYTPEKRSQITEESLSVAIINPVFSDGENDILVQPYSSFVQNMADDFEEVLNANGFKIKGPFNTRDEMVYGDKLSSDFAIEIEVEMITEKGDFGKRPLSFLESVKCKTCYKLGGTFYHKGRIILTATDPIDGEKFWKKTVELDTKPVNANSIGMFNGPTSSLTMVILMEDVGIYNPVAKVLESYYKEAMTNISQHVDAREMAQISKQIKAKRERIGQ